MGEHIRRLMRDKSAHMHKLIRNKCDIFPVTTDGCVGSSHPYGCQQFAEHICGTRHARWGHVNILRRHQGPSALLIMILREQFQIVSSLWHNATRGNARVLKIDFHSNSLLIDFLHCVPSLELFVLFPFFIWNIACQRRYQTHNK